MTLFLLNPGKDFQISTHTSLTGRDYTVVINARLNYEFLLTRPSRDVTGWFVLASLIINISTHTSLTGRDQAAELPDTQALISTHTSLTGRDWSARTYPGQNSISTHTSLTGRDASPILTPDNARNFYSHVPHGT